MSVLGTNLGAGAATGVAAGVAQSGLQAQQVARRQEAPGQASRNEARRVREKFETHLRALDEGDEFESPAQLHVDGEMPEQERRQAPPERKTPGDRKGAALAGSSGEETQRPDRAGAKRDGRSGGGEDGEPLYRHVDVKA